MTIQKERTALKALEAWEFQYYALHVGCTEEELKDAVATVGTCPDTLRTELAGQHATLKLQSGLKE